MTFQTEFEFTLPKGYVDNEGNLLQKGIIGLQRLQMRFCP